MEESLIKPADETIWYENDRPIQEFLESFRKAAILEVDHQAEALSWIKIMKKPIIGNAESWTCERLHHSESDHPAAIVFPPA